MKKLIMTAIIALAFVATPDLNAQDFKVDKSPMDQASFPASYRIADKDFRVTYSRPQLKGRTLDKLAPEGKVYRLGANEAVEVTFYKDAKLGTTPVPAGTYTMYAIPEEKEWTVILNSDLNVWGAYSYDDSKDVARITVPVETDKDSVEYFGMEFVEVDKGAHLVMAWDTLRVQVPFYTK